MQQLSVCQYRVTLHGVVQSDKTIDLSERELWVDEAEKCETAAGNFFLLRQPIASSWILGMHRHHSCNDEQLNICKLVQL